MDQLTSTCGFMILMPTLIQDIDKYVKGMLKQVLAVLAQGRSYKILSGYGVFSTCIYNISTIMFGTSRYEAQFLDDANSEAMSHVRLHNMITFLAASMLSLPTLGLYYDIHTNASTMLNMAMNMCPVAYVILCCGIW